MAQNKRAISANVGTVRCYWKRFQLSLENKELDMTNFETHHNAGELLDVVDETGRPTGQVLPKKDIHAQGLRHRDVHVWITNGRDLLQQQRKADKAIMPGQWDITVGEHVDHGETYRQ